MRVFLSIIAGKKQKVKQHAPRKIHETPSVEVQLHCVFNIGVTW